MIQVVLTNLSYCSLALNHWCHNHNSEPILVQVHKMPSLCHQSHFGNKLPSPYLTLHVLSLKNSMLSGSLLLTVITIIGSIAWIKRVKLAPMFTLLSITFLTFPAIENLSAYNALVNTLRQRIKVEWKLCILIKISLVKFLVFSESALWQRLS